ncbi:MAG: transposase, partial [Athalassotoga sp.]
DKSHKWTLTNVCCEFVILLYLRELLKIKEFLKSGAAKRIHLEALPGYAPELNPTEGIWNWLKKVELKNRCFSDIESLKQGVIEASGRLIEREDVRLGCVAECKYITS